MKKVRFMNRKKIIVLTLFLAIAIAPFLYVHINKMIYVHRVTNDLVNVKGYKIEEIQSVRGVWGIKGPPFFAVVVFKDEPLVEYIYFAHNQVLQSSYHITDQGKKQGITEADLKHWVPFVPNHSGSSDSVLPVAFLID
ncbi:DUF3139 domain-containing protein [Paenibacillus sp. P26]|nr:DUF3139 domain-containing protein [Paenibacillus sp. P26]UUZ94884.1 DUF3139 domain-containing protein [Paenibacillus sp. P25]